MRHGTSDLDLFLPLGIFPSSRSLEPDLDLECLTSSGTSELDRDRVFSDKIVSAAKKKV